MLQLDSDIQMDMGNKQSQHETEKQRTFSKIELESIMNQTQKAVDAALTDKSDGADDRAQEKAYIWTKLDTKSYENLDLQDQNGETHRSSISIADGMKKTGGYEGTDMEDENDNINIQTLS